MFFTLFSTTQSNVSSAIELGEWMPTIEEFRDGRRFAFLLCWDDGRNDLEISFLEDELGLKHTSFVITSRVYDKLLWGLDMLFRGHDIQSHALYHLNLKLLNESYGTYLMTQSKFDIERLFGYSPVLFSYPYGATDLYLKSKVLEYYRVARGISYEKGTELGKWPISAPSNAKHSFPDSDGLGVSNLPLLQSSFETMILNYDEEPLAYKAYGHTQSFTINHTESFRTAFSSITNRSDVWLTSWGEAVAYQIQRDNSKISNFLTNDDSISFRIGVSNNNYYGIPLTYRIPIPQNWDHFTVFDGRKVTDRYSLYNDAEGSYILLNAIPQGQEITIEPVGYSETTKPMIANVRTIVTSEGTAFLADIVDYCSLISDVNFTITGNGTTYEFEDVRNPLFWANSTYGRVLFGVNTGCIQFKITARDASGNIVSIVYELNLQPTHRVDMPI